MLVCHLSDLGRAPSKSAFGWGSIIGCEFLIDMFHTCQPLANSFLDTDDVFP